MYIFGIVICPFFFLGWNLFQFLSSVYEFWYTVFICVFWHFNEFKKLDCELDVFSFILSDQKRSVMVPCTSVLWFPLIVSVVFFFCGYFKIQVLLFWSCVTAVVKAACSGSSIFPTNPTGGVFSLNYHKNYCIVILLFKAAMIWKLSIPTLMYIYMDAI